MQHKSFDGRLRAGIVGGGRGSFIGGVHRMAAQLDGEALIVAGAMSSNPTIARESAAGSRLFAFRVNEARVFANFCSRRALRGVPHSSKYVASPTGGR